jgi:sugar phosphate isomerase/epimerase
MGESLSAAEPLFASSCATTFHSTFEQDVASYREAGVHGLGVWEYKLFDTRDAERAALLAEAGLEATFCFPSTPGVLAGAGLFAYPRDPATRLRILCESIRRLAVYRPAAVICLAGAPDPADPAQSRALVVNGFREAARVAADVGVRLAIEVISPGTAGSLAPSIPAALELAAEAGADNMGVLVDAWHSAEAPGTAADIAKYVDRVAGIQVCDRTPDSRGWYDRAFPGTGTLPLTEMIRAAYQAGYGGWYEMEIFSDDGTFGHDYPDSLWRQPPVEVLVRGRDSFRDVYRSALAGL